MASSGSRNEDQSAFDPTTIDLVIEDRDGEVILVIVQSRSWQGSEAELRALSQKVHNYVAFALDGQLVRHFPDTAGRPWRIELESQAGPPSPAVRRRIDQLSERVRDHGSDLVLSTLSDEGED